MQKIMMIGLALLVLCMTLVPVATAQKTVTDEMALLRADIQADRQAIVAANLGLTEAEGKEVWPLYREYRMELAKVGDRMQKMIQEYIGTYQNMTDEQAKAMLKEFLAIQSDELKIKDSYVKKFGKVLSSVKVVRLYQIENKIDAILRYEMADVIPLVRPGS